MLLSIIIPSFKRPELLSWGLYSLSKQEIPYKYEIIVINDGIQDDTEKICNEFQSQLNIRYVFTGQRNKNKLKWRVPGFAFNIGAKLARGELLIFSSPEIFLLDNFTIKKIIDILNINKKTLIIPSGKDDRYRWETPAGFLEHLKNNNGNINNFNNYDKMQTLNTKLPFFMGLRKSEFIKIGGFDEDLTGYCFDDADLVERLQNNGCHYFQIDSTVIHLYHSRKRIKTKYIKKEWKYNKDIYEKRKGIIIRNENKAWGELPPIEIKQKEKVQNSEILENKIIKEKICHTSKEIINENQMISIIMTTFNRAHLITNSLYSIVNQARPKNVEILIVDDGSTDNIKKIIEEYQQQYPEWNIRYIYNHKQLIFSNPAIALNIALIYAKGDIIIQSGVDLLHLGNVIKDLLKYFKKDEAYYASRLCKLQLGQMNNFPVGDLPKMIKYAKLHSKPQPIKPIVKDEDKNNALPFCAIYRKEWAYKIGLFDEEYLPGGAEDRDFIYRMQKIVPTRWCYNTWVCHQGHKKFAGEPHFDYGYKKNYLRSFNTTEGRENRCRMKILFIGNFNLFPFGGYLWDSLKQSFMRLGHHCKFYDPQLLSITDEDLQENVKKSSTIWRQSKTLKEIQRIADEFKPDIVMTCTGGQWEISKKLKTNALKVAWFGDLRSPHAYSGYRNQFDCLFITNEEQVKKWKEKWNCPVFPIPFAILSTGHYRRNVEQIIDVGFAGKHHKSKNKTHPGYRNRMSLLKKIERNFNLEVLSNAWLQTWEFYSKCKIVISDSHDDAAKTRAYSSNRFFNIVGCGAFCLVRYFPGLEMWGEDGKHFVSFKTNKEAIEKIKYYLRHNKERQKIADAGYNWFHTQHNWMQRAKYMSGIMYHLIQKKRGNK